MQFVPPKPNQRPSLNSIKRATTYGAIAGLSVGVLGWLFTGDAVWLFAVIAGALLGCCVVVMKLVPTVLW